MGADEHAGLAILDAIDRNARRGEARDVERKHAGSESRAADLIPNFHRI
jgi:hypothetical protein